MVLIRALEDRILAEGKVLPGEILKVGDFLNQQIDPELLMEMGEEIASLYKDAGVTKILTIESSGIAVAFAAGYKMNVPVVFAKKHASINLSDDVLASQVYSYTHQKTYDIVVSSDYISKDDTVLIVDDFLAKGNALKGLIEITNKAGAKKLFGNCVQKLYRNDQEIAGKITDFEKEIPKLIGLDQKQFTKCVLLAQGSFDAFLKAKKKERSGILSNITGTEVYGEIGKKIYQLLNLWLFYMLSLHFYVHPFHQLL